MLASESIQSDPSTKSKSLASNLKTTCWQTDSKQRRYTLKLLQAIRQVRRGSSTSPPPPRGVREAADTALAVAAKGQSRWSRAILKNRQRRVKSSLLKRKISCCNNRRVRSKIAKVDPTWRRRKSTDKLQAVQKRLRVLGQLIPGCEKLPIQNLLEEATDYISALEMQIRAMAVLTSVLSRAQVRSLGTNSPSEMS